MSTASKLKAFLTSEHVEVTLRITFTLFLAFVISFLGDNILNPSFRLLFGVVVPFVALLMPTLMFAYGGIVLPMAVLFLICYALVTILLAVAVVGGDAAFISLYGIFVFWMSFLRWEKATGPGTSLLIIAVVFVSIIGFPNFKVVQEGFDVFVTTSAGPDSTDSVALRFLPRNTDLALLSSRYSESLLELLSNNTYSNNYESNQTGIFQMTGGAGDFSGLMVELVDTGTEGDDQYGIFHIPGGMWMVRAMWTTTGLNNPLATMYNVWIMWGWFYLLMLLIYIIPPFRTLRLAFSKGMIPSALSDTAAYIELHSKQLLFQEQDPTDDVDSKDLVTIGQSSDNAIEMKKMQSLRGNMLRHANILFGGNLAGLTAFEPRLFSCKSPVCTWIRLKAVSDSVLKCVLVSVGIEELLKQTDHKQFREISNYYVQTTKVLKSCALALQTGKESFITETLKNGDEESSFSCAADYDPFRMRVQIEAVVDSTKSYLLAMEGKKTPQNSENSTTWNEIKLNILPFYKVFTAYLRGLLNVLVFLFQKSYWEGFCTSPYLKIQRFIWCVKYAVGFVGLLVATVYWEGYNEQFAVTTSLSRVDFGTSLATINGGWTMVAYCFATTQSTEGSVKKGILRLLGTVLGGFFGWLALMVCEDSRFDTDFNPYGLVAWLTITSAITTYSATNRGFFARLGLSADFSFGPIYFIITQVAIVLYCYLFFGPSGRHDVTINRIVSNLVGIAFAMLLAILPLGVWGGNPAHCQEIVHDIENNVINYLELLLASRSTSTTSMPSGLQELSKAMLRMSNLDVARGVRLHELAKDLFEDASRLSSTPFLKTDPSLGLELALVARDVYVSSYVAIIASRIVSNRSFHCLALEEDSVRSKLESFLEKFKIQKLTDKFEDDVEEYVKEDSVMGIDIEDGDDNDTKQAKLLIELFLRLLQMLYQRTNSHHQVLGRVKWGYNFRCFSSNTAN